MNSLPPIFPALPSFLVKDLFLPSFSRDDAAAIASPSLGPPSSVHEFLKANRFIWAWEYIDKPAIQMKALLFIQYCPFSLIKGLPIVRPFHLHQDMQGTPSAVRRYLPLPSSFEAASVLLRFQEGDDLFSPRSTRGRRRNPSHRPTIPSLLPRQPPCLPFSTRFRKASAVCGCYPTRSSGLSTEASRRGTTFF